MKICQKNIIQYVTLVIFAEINKINASSQSQFDNSLSENLTFNSKEQL
jgi:hypothetical protein